MGQRLQGHPLGTVLLTAVAAADAGAVDAVAVVAVSTGCCC